MNENATHRLAAIYARVSTLQQEQEATIDSQVAELEKYAQEKGLRLSKEFYFLDQAISGAQLPRPALDRLRDLAVEGLFDTVLCLSPDEIVIKHIVPADDNGRLLPGRKCTNLRHPFENSWLYSWMVGQHNNQPCVVMLISKHDDEFLFEPRSHGDTERKGN